MKADRDADRALASHARSLLFVPGDRPERFDRALAAGADLVLVDLEDAVRAEAKPVARTALAALLESGRRVAARINAFDTSEGGADIALLDHPNLIAVVVPKAEPGSFLQAAAARCPTIALVETAAGVVAMPQLAATEGVARMALGTVDLALDLGIESDQRLLDPIRLSMTVASRTAGIAPPIDGVTVAFRDEEALREEAVRAAALGFTGKLCIHPAQIAPLHAALRPDEASVREARRILAAAETAPAGAVALDGRMIDLPVIKRAKAILACLGEQ